MPRQAPTTRGSCIAASRVAVTRPSRRGRLQTLPVSSRSLQILISRPSCSASLRHRAGVPANARAARALEWDCGSEMRDLEEFRGGVTPSRGSDEGGAVGSVSWWSGDPEAKRRRRVAGYKSYAMEARVKASLRKGFRWVKDRCTGIVRRW